MTSPKESGAPGTITTGYWLVVTGAALSVLASLFLLLNKQQVIDAAVQANKDPKVTPAALASAFGSLLVISLVVTVVLAGLAVWFAGKVRNGLKKSRTGLMITLLIGLFYQMVSGNTLALVTALIAIAGLVLLYFRQSTEYLTEREQLT